MAKTTKGKNNSEEEKKRWVGHVCRECGNVTPFEAHHTISVNGEYTMGTCPYWTESKCVLMSQQACEHYK